MKVPDSKQQIPSPYWKELHVEDSKKLLKDLDVVLHESDMKSPGSTKLLCKKIFEAHIKRWGREHMGSKTFRSRCIKIHLTPDQKKILIAWIDGARATYNTCVSELIGKTRKADKYQLRNRFVTLENTLITDENFLAMMENVPKDIRAKGAFEACAANDMSLMRQSTINPKRISHQRAIDIDKKKLASVERRLLAKKKNAPQLMIEKDLLGRSIATLTKDLEFIPKFMEKKSVIKFRRRKSPYAHVFIPKTACNVSETTQPDGTTKTSWNIYPCFKTITSASAIDSEGSKLGPIEIKRKHTKDRTRRRIEVIDGEEYEVETTEKGEGSIKPECDFQIRWSRRTDEWHIIIPTEIKVKNPGSKGISYNHTLNSHRTVILDPGVRTFQTYLDMDGVVGEKGKYWYSKIEARVKEMDRCAAISLKGLRGKERLVALNDKRTQYLHLRKIKNYVNEMHKETASFLINNYDVIVLPKLRTKNMIKTRGGLGSKINRMISFLSPCRFHDYLTWKAEVNGKIVIDQNESYTTKTCFECGLLSDPGAGEIYRCDHCDNVCGRDIQACFNILIKYMGSYSPTR